MFSKDDFEKLRKFILKKWDRRSFRNFDNNNPHYRFEDFAARFKDTPKDKTIYLYCKKGGRSAKAQAKLSSLGFTNVINLEGGYDAWLALKK